MGRGAVYRWCLLAAFLLVWVWAAVRPLYFDGWLLENYLVFIFVPLIIISGFYFRLSNVSYTLLTLFMILHVVGSHYTYAEVPFGYWLQDIFGAERNMYDRLVHFCFGFLLAYPIREVFVRLSRAKGFWGLWFPVELTLAFSAVYEIIEWLAAAAVDPAAGLAFLGAQGDVWDAQKDMLLAGIGAIIAMGVAFAIRVSRDQMFWKEFTNSFKRSNHDAPLGEVALTRFSKRKTLLRNNSF
jgi:putative membrane protein